MEKDLLIYNELCKHGQEVFSWLMKQDKGNFKRYSNFKKRNASFLSENLRKLKYDAHSEYWNTPISIVVDTFCCEFLPISVFGLIIKEQAALFQSFSITLWLLIKRTNHLIRQWKNEKREFSAHSQNKNRAM